MNVTLSDFRVVNPVQGTFSAAEARIAKTCIRFNNLTAAELGYPDYVKLMLSHDGSVLAIQPCHESDPCAVPFMGGRSPEDLTGQKKWTRINNRMLGYIIRSKMNWTDDKGVRRFYGSPWTNQGALLFDLSRPAGPRQRTPTLTADEMLSTYALAAQSFVPVQYSNPMQHYSPVPPSEVIEAAYKVCG